MFVCLVAMNSIILLWVSSNGFKELQCQLHSIFDGNLSIVRGWTFAKFFLKWEKNVKCRCNDVKKSKCPEKKKFSKCEEVKKKNVSVEFRVFGKKKLKEKFWVEKKNQSDLGWKFLLSSCSLVGLYVNLQVKVMGKKNESFQSIFRVGVRS